MSTIQLIGIGIAVVILILLVIALVITRRRDRAKTMAAAGPPRGGAEIPPSVFAGAPRDDLHRLHGKQKAGAVPSTATSAADAAPPPTGEESTAEGEAAGPQADALEETSAARTMETDAPSAALWAGIPLAAGSDESDDGLWGRLGGEEPAAAAPDAADTDVVVVEPAELWAARTSTHRDADKGWRSPEASEEPTPTPTLDEPVFPSVLLDRPIVPSVVREPTPAAPEDMPPPQDEVAMWTRDADVVVEPLPPDYDDALPEEHADAPIDVAVEGPLDEETGAWPPPRTRPVTDEGLSAWEFAPPPVRDEPLTAAPAAGKTPPTEPATPAAAEGSADLPAGSPEAAAPAAKTRAPELVHLCDIISTTNTQLVDLNDPDVRRMLRELVQSEVDLAQQYRQLGQNIDAVLQLTEAQKICRALSMDSHAKLLEQMIRELRV